MMSRLVTFCFFLFLCTGLFAQPGSSFYIKQFGTEDGLPSNGIKGLQWDSKTRFLWIATEAGLVRYNGMAFKIFTAEDNPSITNERILFLVQNNAGSIYTADNTGNIFKVSGNTLSFVNKENIAGNPGSNIITIAVSDLFHRAGHNITNGPFAMQFDQVIALSDTSCFIRHNQRLYFFSVKMSTPKLLALSIASISSAFALEGMIFLVDPAGVIWRLDQKTFTLQRTALLSDNSSASLGQSNSLLRWENGMKHPILINGTNAFILNYSEGSLTASLLCDRVPQDALIRFAQYDEKTGTLFIGTDSKGITIIKKNKVLSVRKERMTASQRTSYYSQLALEDGNVLTNEGHILGKNHPEKSTPPFAGPFSISSYLMGDSLFWSMQYLSQLRINCLNRFNLKTKEVTSFKKIRENASQMVMTSSRGQLYLANESGINVLSGDSLRRLYTYKIQSKQNIHFDMKEIRPGVLAIANCNSLLRYDIDAGRMDTLFNTGSYCVRTIWVYKDYVFFGTYGNGLYAMKDGVVRALPLDKNRHLLFTHCFVDDGTGSCWISTNRGLFKASIAEMINAWEAGAPRVYYHYFGRVDGMEMTEMNGGCTPCGITLKDQTISFPTMEGLLWVNPRTAVPELPDGEIFLDEVLVDNRRIEPASLQKPLSPGKHDVVFRLGFSAWCNKENIYLEYRLNNEPEWKAVNIENGSVVQLNNLAQGSYMLQIRKLNGFGVNNYSYREIRFSIPAPWHQRWWFFLLCGLGLLGLIAGYFRFRTRQYKLRQRKLELQVAEKTKELQQQNEILEKNNTIKTRLISIISHDIVTPLKFLTVAGKNLVEKRKLMDEALQQETIQEMANTSQELQLLSTNILNWIKYQNENRRLMKEAFRLHEVTNQVLGVLQSLANQKKIGLVNQTDPDLDVYQYQEPLKILLYNLVSNAINFSEHGNITISNSMENEILIVRVADEGVGMTPEQIQNIMADQFIISSANIDNRKGNGLGYLIVKDLMKMMGASLSIQSQKNKGTIVSVTIPVSRK